MTNTYFLTLACLCAGLLFDPGGFLRMSLVASFIHEGGHILFYLCCTKKLPPLNFTPGGIALKSTNCLSRRQELFVTIAGPLFNFIVAFILYLLMQNKASYMLGFFMAVNMCIGAYNLLPFGMLDGARLLIILLPPCKVYLLYIVERVFAGAAGVLLFGIAIFYNAEPAFKAGLIVAAVYMLFNALKPSNA